MSHVRALCRLTTIALTIAVIAVCGSSHPTEPQVSAALTPVAPSAEWPVATPTEAGVDAARISDLVVVTTSDDDSRFTAAVEFLASHLLPSVTSR